MANGKCDKPEGDIADHRKGIDLLKRTESEIQPSEYARADQYTGDQIRCHIRQMKLYKKTGHQQSGKQGCCNKQKRLHKTVRASFLSPRYISGGHCTTFNSGKQGFEQSGKKAVLYMARSPLFPCTGEPSMLE